MKQYAIYLFAWIILGSGTALSEAQEKDVIVQQTLDRYEKKRTSRRIDVLDFDNVDIRKALEWIAEQTELIIIPGQNMKGRVTLFLKNVDALEAVEIILEAHGFAYEEEFGIVEVMPAQVFQRKYGYPFGGKIQSRIVTLNHVDQEKLMTKLNVLKSEAGRVIANGKYKSLVMMDDVVHLDKMLQFVKDVDVPVETAVFELRYVAVKDMKAAIEDRLTDTFGRVEVDVDNNALIVTDARQKIRDLRTFFDEVDQKVEVMIEAKIIQVELNEQHTQGIDWEAIVSNYQSMNLLKESYRPSSQNKKLRIGTITQEDYEVLLEALETVGELTASKNSRVKAIVNQETKIGIGSYELMTNGKTKDQRKARPEDSEDFNLLLGVTPKLQSRDLIVINLRPKLSWLNETADPSREIYTPLSEIMVELKNNETIVIGGLIGEKEVARTSKIPFLGNLPFLGFAFRQQSRLKAKTEYVIFLTQKIIENEMITD